MTVTDELGASAAPVAAPKVTGGKKRQGDGGGEAPAKKRKPGLSPCSAPDCVEPKYAGKPCCAGHNKNWDALRLQALSQQEKEGNPVPFQKFLEASRVDAIIGPIVAEYTKDNPLDKKYVRKSLTDWCTFGRDTGTRAST